MANPFTYKYPELLAGFEDAPPLSEEKAEDGKSLINPKREGLSDAYERFTAPLERGREVAYNQAQAKYARDLWERIRREFPELRVYRFWDRPIGPHPIAMFEVNVFTPLQFGAFVAWLAIWRGPLSALVHPNTVPAEGETLREAELRNHTEQAIWMGERVPLDLRIFAPSVNGSS
ncbi:putative 21.2 kDa protein [Cladobotryum mycophilum]|uniref:21.2 kDa protein n=1 Tax=Cladobotryum mycophilum TaxID=491253 RepID=A0ABR0S911_9HYPO